MTDDAYGATIAKRRLSERLGELRLGTGYTANHVCDILNWGRGKVGRFEANQWKRPEMSDVRDLLRIYGVTGGDSDEVEELAMKARARPWWRDFPETFDSEFPGYENDATSIGVFMPLILPGLMQTEAYTESLLRTGPRPPTWRRKALEARLRRQEIRRDHRGVAAVPVGDADRPPGAGRAPDRPGRLPQRGTAGAALRGRAPHRGLLHGQPLRL
jgi:hypothetical protein